MMSQTVEHDLSVATDHVVLDSGFSRVIVLTEVGDVVARDLVLAQAAAALVASSLEHRRTPLDLLEAVCTPLDEPWG